MPRSKKRGLQKSGKSVQANADEENLYKSYKSSFLETLDVAENFVLENPPSLLGMLYGDLPPSVVWKFLYLVNRQVTPEEQCTLLCMLTDYLSGECVALGLLDSGNKYNTQSFVLLQELATTWNYILQQRRIVEDKNLLGSLLSNLRCSIATFSTFGLDHYFSTTLDMVSKIESGQPVDPYYSYPMIPKNYSIPEAKIKRILSVRKEPRKDPYFFTERSVCKPRIQLQNKARWADTDDEWVPPDEKLDSSCSDSEIERSMVSDTDEESFTEDVINLDPLIQEPLKNITNFSASERNCLLKLHGKISTSKLEELDCNNKTIDSDSSQENITSKQNEISSSSLQQVFSDESDYSLSPRKFHESPLEICKEHVVKKGPELKNSWGGWEENKKNIKKRKNIHYVMGQDSPRSRKDCHVWENSQIKKTENIYKPMEARLEEKKRIKKRKYQNHSSGERIHLPIRSRDDYLDWEHPSLYDSLSSDDSLPFIEKKENRIQSMDYFSPKLKEKEIFQKIREEMTDVCADHQSQHQYLKYKTEMDIENNFADEEDKDIIPLVLKKLSGKKRKESIAKIKQKPKKQVSQQCIVDSDSSLPELDGYLAPNMKNESLSSPFRKTVSENGKKFTRKDDSPWHYKENNLNERRQLSDDEEYHSGRYGLTTFYSATSNESSLNESDFSCRKSSIHYPLLSNWEDMKNVFDENDCGDDFGKTAKQKHRQTEHTPSRKSKQKMKRDHKYTETRKNRLAKNIKNNLTQKEIKEHRKKKMNVNRRCISVEDFIKDSPRKYSNMDFEEIASQKDKTPRSAEYCEDRHHPAKCSEHCYHESRAIQCSNEPTTDRGQSTSPTDPYKTPEIAKRPPKNGREILPISPGDIKKKISKTKQDIRNYLKRY